MGQAYLGFPESVTLTESIGSVENPGTVTNYDSGRTLTHELGHNFTFNHTFNGSTCGTQYWSDFHLKQLIIVVQIFMNGQLVVEIFMVDKQKIVVLVQVEKVINS
ncbi:MAG: hypothetical protein Ct9H90mP15_04780 [Candidatus Neomarinimicrobiota bacterium]|nr:MAG: hypothetical protein Ct9H90mP15_04780 [Candidatus Neomarinimicrobiota bacterium]